MTLGPYFGLTGVSGAPDIVQWVSEDGDSSNVICRLLRHWRGREARQRYWKCSDQIDHESTL